MLEKIDTHMNTLNSLIDAHAHKQPDAPALIYDEQVITYLKFNQRSRTVAASLAKLGIGEGDRVAIWLPNIPAWLEVFFACAQLGAIAVAVNTRFRSSEVSDLLKLSGSKLLVFWPDFKGINFTNILSKIDISFLTTLKTVVAYSEGYESAPTKIDQRPIVPYNFLLRSQNPLAVHAAADTGCIIFTTSGTTKLPKLVLHKQSGVVQHARDVAIRFGYDQPKAMILQAVPFCGVYGFSQAVAAFAGGAGMICVPAFDVDDILKLIDKHRITQTNGSDEMFARLLEARPELNPFPTMNFCGYANFTPSLGNVVDRADQQGLKLVGLYGSSELLALFAMQRPDDTVDARARMGGFPVSDLTKVRVRDPENGRLLKAGQIGELEFKCPSLMHQYFNNTEATTAAVTGDAFFRSGDLGRICTDGSFEFLSRMGDVLRLGGFLVNPQEIETYIRQHPDVDGCQIIGVDGPRGTRPVGFVMMQKAATTSETDLLNHCRAGMANFKVPARIFLIDKFPTTTGPSGTKIQRTKLREMAMEKLGAVNNT